MEQKILSLKDDKIVSEVELIEYPEELRGGRNLVRNSNNNDLFNMFRTGVQYTKTSGVTVPEWKASEANRIQTTGGIELLKFYATLINIKGEILAGDIVSASIYIKNNSANSIKVDSNLGGREQTINAGQAVRIRWNNITFNNVNPLQVRVYGAFTTDSLDFIWWRAKAEKGNKATDWTSAPEDLDLTYPDFITEFKPSISDRYILTEELIEGQSTSFSNNILINEFIEQ